MEIRVLGPLEVIHQGTAVELPAGRVRELLLRLTVAGPRSLPVEQLISELWPQRDSGTTTSTARTYVARLRNALPEDVIVTRVGGYALDRSRVELDAERFEDEFRTARSIQATEPLRAAALLQQALGRWRGDALDEVADREWAAAAATRLEEARLGALELQAEAQLAAGGQAATVAAHLAELTREHPLRERLWQHRMVALYRCGRQADALACYQEVRAILRDELGIEPGADLRELERAILAHEPWLDEPTTPAAAVAPIVAAPADVPATSLIGRAREQQDVVALLATDPIVTLTGPAGVGKSRLARVVAASLTAERRDGTATIDVAPIGDGTDLVSAVAARLGIGQRGGFAPVELLAEALEGSDLLLLLDDCEHVASAVGDLAAALTSGSPQLRILATSRVPLGTPRETVVPVRPLSVPVDGASLAEVAAADAVRLFVGRAAVVSSDFELDAANAAAVASICRRLDGLPLAIELAAARVQVLTPADVEVRLDERFGLLSGEVRGDVRYETLREAIAWSYDLLDDDEQRAFRRLARFVGAFDVPSATAIIDVGRDDEVVDLLAALIDRSLLGVERRGSRVRYRMLENLRAFGRERLEDTGELVATSNRHARHMVRLATAAGQLLHGPREAEGHEVLETVRDDLRAAFDWCLVAGRWGDAARIVTSIPWERVGRTLQWDVARWATRLVEEEPALDPSTAARVHGTATVGYWLAGDAAAAAATGDRALELAEHTDDETYVEAALAVAWVRWEAGDVAGAASLYLPLADPSLGEKVAADVAAYCLGGMVMGMTESGLTSGSAEGAATAGRLSDAAIELAERSGSPAARAMAHLARAYSLLDADPETARRELERTAEVDGLALPTWSLHARSHLARYRAAAGEHEGLREELADILSTALASVDEMHLRLIGGFVGGALAVAGQGDLAPTLRTLAVDAFTGPGDEGWRRDVAERLDIADRRRATPSLAGLALERAVRDAVAALTGVSPAASR